MATTPTLDQHTSWLIALGPSPQFQSFLDGATVPNNLSYAQLSAILKEHLPVLYKLYRTIGPTRVKLVMEDTIGFFGSYTTSMDRVKTVGGIFLKVARTGSVLSESEKTFVYRK